MGLSLPNCARHQGSNPSDIYAAALEAEAAATKQTSLPIIITTSEPSENKQPDSRSPVSPLKHWPHQYSLGFLFPLTFSILNVCLLTLTIIENQRAEKKSLQDFFFKAIIFFWWAIDFGNGGFKVKEGASGVCVCLPVRAPGPPALFCCDACVLSLAWLGSLHLMVYSYSVVQDAVPWGSSRTQYVWIPVLLYGRLKCFALVLRLEQRSFSKSTNTTDFLHFSPERQMFYSRQTRIFSIILLYFTLRLVMCSLISSVFSLLCFILFS